MLRLIATLTAASLTVGLAAAADPKPTAEKLAGSWKLVKSADPAPAGTTVVLNMTKDGKLTIVMEQMGKKQEIPGTWKLDGTKLTTTMTVPNGKGVTEIMTIKTLTDEDFVTIDEKGKADEFKKVKK